ncbi:MAG: long-chain-fatty-acid--CoA ligase [Spirochaetaceae bacterium]|nr:long-chain-fatty-acid--CoA ligase [Spirochaetaceae bacterium]
METLIYKTPSAYSSPLLIKNILLCPHAYNPDQEIVYKDIVRISYRQMRDRVARLASALIEMGVKPGDVVAVMDWDSHRYLECYFAIPMIGAVLHMVNIRMSAEQMIYTIAQAEDKVILVNSDFLPILEQIKGRINTVKHYVLLSNPNEIQKTSFEFSGIYEDMLERAKPLAEFPDFDENTRATTFFSTGTTGLPKGVYFSHRQIVIHTLAMMSALTIPTEKSRLHMEDVYMPITPMYHVHAWGIPFIATMLGLKQVFPGKYLPDVLLKLIAKEKVTYSHCVPTIVNMLLSDSTSENYDLSHWKVIIGGSALPRAIAIKALKRGIDIYCGYGMSETCPVITVQHLSTEEQALPVEDKASLLVRAGRPIGLVDMKVMNAEGEAPRDDKTTGEVLIRAPWYTQGYLKDTSNSEKLWEGGWMHTQDVGCRDSTGSLRITDRIKDVIKIGGEWISSLEIEDILCLYPAIAEVAIIGYPHTSWGEVPFALVVPKAGETIKAKEIVKHVKKYIDLGLLPREAVLTKVKFVQAIDKTSVGKINKVELRKKHLPG